MTLKLSPQERLALRWTLLMLPVAATLGVAVLLAIVVQPFFFILSMFFLAWILAFLLDPIVTWIVRRLPRLPRGLTAALVFFGLTALILIGDLDDWTPAADCSGKVAGWGNDGPPVELVIYPGAYHGFYYDYLQPGRKMFDHWLEYNGAAADDSDRRLRQFLDRHVR